MVVYIPPLPGSNRLCNCAFKELKSRNKRMDLSQGNANVFFSLVMEYLFVFRLKKCSGISFCGVIFTESFILLFSAFDLLDRYIFYNAA